jgi:hypothetical protein
MARLGCICANWWVMVLNYIDVANGGAEFSTNLDMTLNSHIKSHYVCQCFQKLSRETNIQTRP